MGRVIDRHSKANIFIHFIKAVDQREIGNKLYRTIKATEFSCLLGIKTIIYIKLHGTNLSYLIVKQTAFYDNSLSLSSSLYSSTMSGYAGPPTFDFFGPVFPHIGLSPSAQHRLRRTRSLSPDKRRN